MFKGLYLGAELGLGYTYFTSIKASLEGSYKINVIDRPQNSFETTISKETVDKISVGNLAFKCNPMIRLGWKF